MCESVTATHRRRSVKFTDAPPEVLRFSYHQPNWVIPLSSSASTSSIGSLKKALDEERQKANKGAKIRTVALRRSVKLNVESVQSWSLNRRKLASRIVECQPAIVNGVLKKRKEVFSSETDETTSDDTRSSSCSSKFSRVLSQSCDSLCLRSLKAVAANCVEQSENNNKISIKNCLNIESDASSKDCERSVEAKSGIIRGKLRTALRADRAVRYSEANNAGDADGRWLSSEFEMSTVNEDDDLEMARHIAECLEQFNTGLDKVLQARQLLESTQDLPLDDKDKMLRVLNQAIRTGRKRLDVPGEHSDMSESRIDSPTNTSPHRQNIQTSGIPTSDFQGPIDQNAFFQRYGSQLLALVQNQAKQN